ncbi:MAG TPA: indole-3-glycerol-phosphate synthase [Polyangiaceae bacterium]|jgi:indole-3-glycerol phosphate synthase|nr:indole-3-glycerol-phosphate synthase [Polyangiaceae bacterium]
MGVLQQIIDNKRREIESLTVPPGSKFEPRPVELRRSVTGRFSLISEIKLRSPSAGALSRTLNVSERARAYADAGASLISVLCDERYFDGSFLHLERAREACDVPLLCKEFVLDEIQLEIARAHGADAILLIVRCLEPAKLEALLQAALRLGLFPLVEAHTPAEAALAVELGAQCIGVNARDLDRLEMDRERAAKIIAELPEHVTRLHLSGVRNESDIEELLRSRADGALIGETLMRADDPRPVLGRLVRAARGETVVST